MKNIIKKILLSEKSRLLVENKIKVNKIESPKNKDERTWNHIVDLYNSGKVELCNNDKPRLFGADLKPLKQILVDADTKFYNSLPDKIDKQKAEEFRNNIEKRKVGEESGFDPHWFKLKGANRKRGFWFYDNGDNKWKIQEISFPNGESIASFMIKSFFPSGRNRWSLTDLEYYLYKKLNCCEVMYNGQILNWNVGNRDLDIEDEFIEQLVTDMHIFRIIDNEAHQMANWFPLVPKNRKFRKCPKTPTELMKSFRETNPKLPPPPESNNSFGGNVGDTKHNSGSLINTTSGSPSKPPQPPQPPPKLFKFNMYFDIVRDSLKPFERDYKFKMGDFFRVGKKEELKLSNFLRAGRDNIIKGLTSKVIKKLNFYEWEVIFRPFISNVQYGSETGNSNILVNMGFEIKINDDDGNDKVFIKTKGVVGVPVTIYEKGEYEFSISPSEMSADVIEVKPTGKEWVDTLFTPDNISFTNGVLYISKEYKAKELTMLAFGVGGLLPAALTQLPGLRNKVVEEITIPIDVSDELSVSFNGELPIPENIPFTINLPSGKKDIDTELIDNTYKLSNDSVFYGTNIKFSDFIEKAEEEKQDDKPDEEKQSSGTDDGAEPIIVGKEIESGIEINESESKSIDKTIPLSMTMHSYVIQELVNKIGPITFTKSLTDLFSKDMIPDLSGYRDFIWQQLKNSFSKTYITISNIVVSKESSNELKVKGLLTMSLKVLQTELVKNTKESLKAFGNPDEFTGMNIYSNNTTGKIKKTVPFSGIIKVEKQNRKFTFNMVGLYFDINQFLNLSVSNDGDGVKFTPSAKSDNFSAKATFEGGKYPLSFTYEIPKLEGKKAKITLGNNITEVNITPTNSYELYITEKGIAARSDVEIKSMNVDNEDNE